MKRKRAILSVHLLVGERQRPQVLPGQLEIQPLTSFLIIWTEETKMESWRERPRISLQFLRLCWLHQAISSLMLMERKSLCKDSLLMYKPSKREELQQMSTSAWDILSSRSWKTPRRKPKQSVRKTVTSSKRSKSANEWWVIWKTKRRKEWSSTRNLRKTSLSSSLKKKKR